MTVITEMSVNADLGVALARVRWETPNPAALAQGLAAALIEALPVVAIELSLGDDDAYRVWRTHEGLQTRRCRARTILDAGLIRRPPDGWESNEAPPGDAMVQIDRRIEVALACRHAPAYLTLWCGRAASKLHTDVARLQVIAANTAMLCDAHVLLHRVASLSRGAHEDNQRLRRTLRDTLGDGEPTRSPAMRLCLERADAVAPHETSVLVTGPSGAGKELVARRIHARSGRVDAPFITLNCGAVPEALAQSELFGHVRGAFTGASATHRGVFERAHRGTLLLDEVGELTPAVQVKLLRVLQQGTLTPVGSQTEVSVDVRVIAATHRDLAQGVRHGTFREDLYYRLAVFECAVPGLRERLEDLPGLVGSCLKRLCARMSRPVPVVPRAVMKQLVTHAWPGNVRELHNVLEGALIMSPRDRLAVPALSPSLQAEPEPVPAAKALNDVVRAAIEAALRACGGKIYGRGGAAERLHLNPGTLQSKMRKLGIERGRFVAA